MGRILQERCGGGGGAGERKEGDGSRVKQSTITAVVCISGSCKTRVSGHKKDLEAISEIR